MIKAIIFDFWEVIGYRKSSLCKEPSKKIYLEVLKKLKVKGDECVFIDNEERNIKTAKSLGMKTILFKSMRQLRKELRELLRK